MRHWKKAAFALVLIAPVGALLFFRQWLNETYAAQEGTVTAVLFLFSAYMFLYQVLYATNQDFYLLVRRALLHLRPRHTLWRLTHRLTSVPTSPGEIALKQKFDAVIREFAWGEVINDHGTNYLSWVIDDRDRIGVEIDTSSENAIGQVDVVFSTSKLLVPSYEYRRMGARLTAICQRLEAELRPRDVQSRLEFSFPRSNPYFGFFVSKVPAELVKSFRCIFTARDSAGRGCLVTATEREIHVDGSSRDAVAEVALSYLTLSARLVGEAG